ncbi:hypothetical protein PISMIDRAFT_680775 [Pisolithus microcarpus 441]|uniref:Uncharacterized protein n=1 Tax=Pisolithus microcarpus 441 TaxID=765257 RepID=A0A0C9YBD4_9AGAM|nr:hypothetical protein PISMIDRAFT_680775 [Pisolithus microcarpus 441]
MYKRRSLRYGPSPAECRPETPSFPSSTTLTIPFYLVWGFGHAVDRACPYFLGISCPVPQFNAAVSYDVGSLTAVTLEW